jgi:hypothetical protein
MNSERSMSMRSSWFSALLAAALFASFMAVHAAAQTKLAAGVVGCGGGRIADVNHAAAATVGQPMVGSCSCPTNAASVGFWYARGEAVTAVGSICDLPLAFRLDQNFPNPFNPTTLINYQLSSESGVKIRVYDVLGREIAVIVDERQQAGVHSVSFHATNLASGVYFYRIEAKGNSGVSFVSTRKMMLVK